MDISDDIYLHGGFTEINNIVHYLYENGLFTDIECRKIVFTGLVQKARESIYEIIQTKDVDDVKKIIEIFRSRSSPTWNPKILKRIFSFLNCGDIRNCRLICKDWNVVVDCLYDEKYSDGKIINTFLYVLYRIYKIDDSVDDSVIGEIEDSCDVINRRSKIHSFNSESEEDSEYYSVIEDIEDFYYDWKTNEKKAIFFLVLLSRDPEEMENTMLIMLEKKKAVYFDYGSGLKNDPFVAEPFWDFTGATVEQPKPSFYESKEHRDNLIAKVLKNHTVLNTTFKFLSTKEARTCRIVCRDWNYVAEPFIRNNAIIGFNYYFTPSHFIRVSAYSSVPDLQFKNFHFQNSYSAERDDKLATFFSKFGGDIRRLKFDEDLLFCIPLCLSFTSNLTKLIIEGNTLYGGKMPDDKCIPLEKLHSIKYLILKYCSICAVNPLEIRRITPMKINLHQVNFYIDGNVAATLNDFVDFTQAKAVNIHGLRYNGSQIFDWGRDIFSVERMEFSNIRFLNADKSKCTVNYLKLKYGVQFSGKMSINIKHLIFKGLSDLDISNLPFTIEKIGFHYCYNSRFDKNQSIHLPYLNYLSVLSDFTVFTYEFLSHLKHCNITHLEVSGHLDIDQFPGSVNILKVDRPSTPTKFNGDNIADSLDLEFLMVGFTTCHDLNNIPFLHTRPKKLVLQLWGGYERNVFISFLRRNKYMEKIYVHLDCHDQPSYDFCLEPGLYYLVDKNAKFYEFSNGRGKSISKEEFFAIKRIADWSTAMNEYPAGQKERTDDLHLQHSSDDCYDCSRPADGIIESDFIETTL